MSTSFECIWIVDDLRMSDAYLGFPQPMPYSSLPPDVPARLLYSFPFDPICVHDCRMILLLCMG